MRIVTTFLLIFLAGVLFTLGAFDSDDKKTGTVSARESAELNINDENSLTGDNNPDAQEIEAIISDAEDQPITDEEIVEESRGIKDLADGPDREVQKNAELKSDDQVEKEEEVEENPEQPKEANLAE